MASVIFHDKVFMMDPPSRFLDDIVAGSQATIDYDLQLKQLEEAQEESNEDSEESSEETDLSGAIPGIIFGIVLFVVIAGAVRFVGGVE